MESQAEEEQLPQIVDELHDTFVTVGAPIITLQIKVKGMNNYHKIITLELFNVCWNQNTYLRGYLSTYEDQLVNKLTKQKY